MDPTLTRKQYLEKKYREFTKELSEQLCNGIFHSLDECCMVDILLYFQFTFCNIEDYEEAVRLILKHHMDISDEKFQEVYPTIKKYIEDLKEFLKNN